MVDIAQQRELVLGEGQYAYVQDMTKGHVGIYTGPHKTSLAQSDTPVRLNPGTMRFDRCALEEAIQEFVLVPEGSYVVLSNPSKNDGQKHPTVGNMVRPQLDHGRKIVIAGPASFALWPGQHAHVIEGHRLRSNQYLIAHVYNDDAAEANWQSTVLQPATTGSVEPDKAADKTMAATKFVVGQKLVIKGTEVSFFIPPTGIEVEEENDGSYVREAVTLERLEYCLLLAENGEKRYVRGPDVVFPEPTEIFIERDDKKKFSAIELNDDMGIHIKVIADYEENAQKYAVGDELFITGKEQKIYYPREEHAHVKYGESDRIFGTVIPKGEARYVLNKVTGVIDLIEGPRIFLPDPRSQVVVRRVLTEQQVLDWFPENRKAVEFNAALRAEAMLSNASYVDAAAPVGAAMPLHDEVESFKSMAYAGTSTSTGGMTRGLAPTIQRGAVRKLAGDTFNRQGEYTPPRTITIDPRFDGAVQVTPWIGYAVLILGKNGSRRVVIGPDTTNLGFDEKLQVLALSTGKPKNMDKVFRTAYLAVANNQVSDIVSVVTKDMVNVDIKVAYRVNFIGGTEAERLKWFGIQNYVKFLCDHLRSILRGASKELTVAELNQTYVTFVRDKVLGHKTTDKRPGKFFEENGMLVYDVEVLGITIGDAAIAKLLADVQHRAVQDAFQIAEVERRLDYERRNEEANRTLLEEKEKTKALSAQLAQAEADRSMIAKLMALRIEAEQAEFRQKIEKMSDEHRTLLSTAENERMAARQIVNNAESDAAVARALLQVRAEADAYVAKFGAISPQFIAALEAFGADLRLVEASKAMGPLAILGGESIADVLGRIFKGTKLESVVAAMGKANGVERLLVPAAE